MSRSRDPGCRGRALMSSNFLDESIRVTHLRVGSPQPRIQALAGAEPDQQLLDVASLRGVASSSNSRVIGMTYATNGASANGCSQRLEMHTDAQVGPRAVPVAVVDVEPGQRPP